MLTFSSKRMPRDRCTNNSSSNNSSNNSSRFNTSRATRCIHRSMGAMVMATTMSHQLWSSIGRTCHHLIIRLKTHRDLRIELNRREVPTREVTQTIALFQWRYRSMEVNSSLLTLLGLIVLIILSWTLGLERTHRPQALIPRPTAATRAKSPIMTKASTWTR